MEILAINDEIVASWKDVYQKFEQNTEGKTMKITTKEGDYTIAHYTIAPYSKFVLDNQRSLGGSQIPMVTLGLDFVPKYKFNFGKTLIYPFSNLAIQ